MPKQNGKSFFMKNRSILFMISLLGVFHVQSASHVVKAGENMYRIALHYKVSVAELQAANPKARVEALRVGQNLVIPKNAPGAVASTPASVARTKVAATGSHFVAAGETLSSIARSRGIAVADLQAMNPNINPTALRIGQSIAVGGRPVAKPADTQIAANLPRSQPKKEVVVQHNSQRSRVSDAPSETTTTKTQMIIADYTQPAPVPILDPVIDSSAASASGKALVSDTTTAGGETTVNAPAPETNAPQETSSQSKEVSLKMIKTTREMTLADFASEHGLTTTQLNTFNGWNFPPNTLLAVDSELNVPAQP